MKVLMINVVCGIRSTGRICTDIAIALDNLGHEVKIAYGREDVPNQFQKYAVKIGTNKDIFFHGIKARMFDGSGWGSKIATEKFIDWIKAFNPDVIHLHNIHGYYINIKVLFNYLKKCGKKIVWTLHDCWAFTGHSVYCDVCDCTRWIDGCYSCPIIKEYPKSYMDRSKKNWIKKKELMEGIPNLTIVTPSKWLAGLVNQSFLKQYPTVVINNGINTELFVPEKSNFKEEHNIEDKFMLLGVSTSWDNMKGLSDFVELSHRLDSSYQIVLVGLTKKQIHKIPKKIIGIERTNSIKELSQIYSAADLFLNLSYCENYPTVNLEAMACNTPVLTYNVGGSPESVKNHKGIIVNRGNVDEVLSNIETYRKDNSNKTCLELDLLKIDKKGFVTNYLRLLEQL